MRKTLFRLIREPTIFLMEKLSFSLKFFSCHFYGQSFIKTVRGPLGIHFLNSIARKIFVIKLSGFAEFFTFSIPAPVVSVLADIGHYAMSSLI